MKKLFTIVVSSISTLFLRASVALAQQDLPQPDMSVWSSDRMKPVRDFANITIGVIFGLAVLYAVIMIAWYGIKLQSTGSDPIKNQEAKHGLKHTIMGVSITFAAIFIVGIILYVLGLVGLSSNA